MHRRRIIKLCVFVVAGAIANVAVAWGCVIESQKPGFHPYADGQYQVWGASSTKFFSVCFGVFDASEIRNRFTGFAMVKRLENDQYPFEIPTWSRFRSSVWPLIAIGREGEVRDVDYFELAAGWPMYSVRYRWVREFDPMLNRRDTSTSTGLFVITNQWLNAHMPLELPALPIWPGFAINTVFYAAILWLLCVGPGFVRRRIRARRGQCPGCAYPIGTSNVCTECGAAVTPTQGVL